MIRAARFLLTLTVVAFCGCAEPDNGIGPLLPEPPHEPDHNAYTGKFLLWPLPKPVISRWDAVIRHVSDREGYDWRFISAIAKAESDFYPNAVSSAGAVGLMQVMPSVARDFGVAAEKLYDPVVNVELGIALLDRISETLRFSAGTSERDRLSITLAAYNAGMGHVLDARRLALKYGENYNSWNVVSKYLVLESDPLYYEDGDAVRSGAFTGSRETLSYVRKVLHYYNTYRRLAEE